MKKLFLFAAAMLCSVTMVFGANRTIYLNSNIWYTSSPVFFVHAWGGAGDLDLQLTQVKDSLFKVDIPDDKTGLVFVRMQTGATEIKWKASEGMWNKTCDLTLSADDDSFIITEWEVCDYNEEGTGDAKKASGGIWYDSNAKFYATGNAAFLADAGSSAAAWASNAIKSNAASMQFSLKKDVLYKVKLTDGTWNKEVGFYDKIDKTVSSAGLYPDESNNICFKLAADGKVTFELLTSGLIQVSGNFKDAPTINDGYYLLKGDKIENMIAVLSENPSKPGVEWMGSIGRSDNLQAGDKLIAVEIKDDAIVTWFPADKTPYTVTAEFAAKNLDVYFMPAGNSPEWNQFGGYIWLAEQTPSDIQNVQTESATQKIFRNGQLYIIRDGVMYNAQGAIVE